MIAQLFINEHARRGRDAAPFVRDALRRSGVQVVEGSVADAGVAVDCVIAAGGDGTLVSAIRDAIALGVPLGLIPLGTFNELARTLGIPIDIERAVEVIAAAHQRTIDVASVNGAYFVNEASIGISSRVTRLQTPELKQRYGFFGVLATAMTAMRHARPFHAELHFDGTCEYVRTIQLTVANSHRFGGFLQVADAAIDDGWLDLYSIDIRSLWEAFSIARAMIAGKRREVPGLRVRRATRFEIRTRRPHRIIADGEPAGETPAVFEVIPGALRVFVPAS